MERFIRPKTIVWLLIAAILLVTAGFALDNRLQITAYELYDSRIPQAFDGCVIAQLSDLHCQVFGKNQTALIDAVKSGNPDYIMLTGDIMDAYIRDYDSIEALFAGLAEIAPVYAVSGNHEVAFKDGWQEMRLLYKKHGVTFLNDESTVIQKGGASLFIFGSDDRVYRDSGKAAKYIPKVDENTFGILLYHRANFFEAVRDFGYALVLSGHTHGGLIRIPFAGGAITPDGKLDIRQKYDGGMYTENGSTLVSNRGLAPSHGIPRIFNRPEVVFVTLRVK